MNLCLFQRDFNLLAVWHFFATSHGKSPCDALGGLFKRNARNWNMQHALTPIDTAKKLYDYAVLIKDSKVHFIYCSRSEHENIEKSYRKRFNQAIRLVEGTQSFHSFTPVDEKQISARSYSEAEESETFDLLY